jgi:hypothetical protein
MVMESTGRVMAVVASIDSELIDDAGPAKKQNESIKRAIRYFVKIPQHYWYPLV